MFKITVRVILGDPSCTDCNARFTMVPLKALYELDSNVFNLENLLFSSARSLQKLFARKHGETVRIKHV